MAVRKPCRGRGCKASPRCAHPWWLDVMHKGVRYRMAVDDFAFARGATAPVASKEEAAKVWEPKFIAEIVSGKDPRVVPERKATAERAATVADLLKLYRKRYVDVEPLKSRAGMVSQLNILNAHLGHLPATALEMAEERWRKVNGSELLPLVRTGVRFVDGVQEAPKTAAGQVKESAA